MVFRTLAHSLPGKGIKAILFSVQFSSFAQSCLTLWDPMNCSTPGLPVHHQLLEVTQTHVHWVSDAIQPSHPLSSPFPHGINILQNLLWEMLPLWDSYSKMGNEKETYNFVTEVLEILSSVQISHSVMSDSLRPHEPQHTRPPCLSPTPGAHPNPCPSCRWCHPTISSSVVPFSSCPQSFPSSGSFQMSQLFASSGQNTGVSASTSVLTKNTQDWSPLGWTGWISLKSKGLSRVFSNTTVQKHQFFSSQLSL